MRKTDKEVYMEGLIATWVLVGLSWLFLFEKTYRVTIRPSFGQYIAFLLFVLVCWPYALYLISRKNEN